jgi:hypothetical protein
VLDANPEKVYDVDVVVPIDEPFKNNSYPEAPEDAPQLVPRLLVVMLVKEKLVGCDGAGGGPATAKLPETVAEPIGVLPLLDPLKLIVDPGVTFSVPENKTNSPGWTERANVALPVPEENALFAMVAVVLPTAVMLVAPTSPAPD